MVQTSRTCRDAMRRSSRRICFDGDSCRMRPPERGKRGADLLDLICNLIEQPSARIGAKFLELRGGDLDRLAEIGFLRLGATPSTIACRACDADHAATLEFDSLAERYFHFCPVAGRVEVNSHDLG